MHFSLSFITKLYRVGFFLVLILILVDLLTFFYYPKTIFADVFLATREQTPLTWLSSLAFFFIALSSFAVYHRSKKRLWYFLAIVFFFFSMDDATFFHERVSGFLSDSTGLFGAFPTYTWVLLYFPLLAFSLGALFLLLWKDAVSEKGRKLIIGAVIMLGAAILLDLADGFVQKSDTLVFCIDATCQKATLHLMRLAEEVLEVFALGVLGFQNIRRHCVKSENTKQKSSVI